MLLRHYLEQGLSKTKLAGQLGVSRRTIYHWLETGQLDRELDDAPVRYTPRQPAVKKIDPYRGIIACRLATYPELTAVRLFEELRAAGYTGGYTQLKAYVRTVRPHVEPPPVVRFETPAGHQAQVDFAHFKLPWGWRYALLVVLSYSRLLWLRFYAQEDMHTLMRGLEAAFRAIGGVPAELLFDQMRAVIIGDHRAQGGPLVENEEFRRFARHWDFRVRACRPYRAQTKGKVERPIRYVRQSFFYGRDFLNDEDLNAQAERWLERVANTRRHRTLGERPQVRFERDERAALRPLAARPYRSPVLNEPRPASPRTVIVPAVSVERRSLKSYDQLVEGAL